MKNLKINVPNMQSSHCQTRVNTILKEIQGVQVEIINAGNIEVKISGEDIKSKVVAAIEKAGYTIDSVE